MYVHGLNIAVLIQDLLELVNGHKTGLVRTPTNDPHPHHILSQKNLSTQYLSIMHQRH